MLYFTTTHKKISLMESKIRIVQGGQGAGKTRAIIQILFKKALEGDYVITVMSDTYDNLKDGAILDFQDVYRAVDRDWDNDYNKSSHELKINNSIVQFRYISDNKPMAGKSKRRDILFLNEANKIKWGAASTYIGRTKGEIYIDFNPDRKCWIHTELPKLLDKATGEKLASKIIVTWKDNELCPKAEKDYIESRRHNKEWYRIYGEGKTGVYSVAQIYRYTWVDEVPKKAKRIPSGMDFGKSPDKTVLVNLYTENDILYVDVCFAENNLMPEKITGAIRKSIVDKMNEIKFDRNHLIIADSAGKTEINDLRKHNYNVIGAKKGAGSVMDGITKLKGYAICIVESKGGQVVADAIDSWFYKTNDIDEIIPEPSGHEPDVLAAVRYAVMNIEKTNRMTQADYDRWNNLPI